MEERGAVHLVSWRQQWAQLRTWFGTAGVLDHGDRPSVLAGWSVRDLVAHIGRGFLTASMVGESDDVPLTIRQYVIGYTGAAGEIEADARVAATARGVDLLRSNHMPEELEPYVAEHHGTTVLSYFFKRALEEGQVEELNFRYPGPRPGSKESAILMLADAVESASRTLSDPSPSSIRSLIDRLIQQRQQDGQLDQAPLTFQDLEVIANTFERMLTAILHRRVSYPSAEEVRGLKRVRAAHSDTYAAPPGEVALPRSDGKEAAAPEASKDDGADRATGRDGTVPAR